MTMVCHFTFTRMTIIKTATTGTNKDVEKRNLYILLMDM